MHLSESHADFCSLETGEYSGLPPRGKEWSLKPGFKVLPIVHPTLDKFPPNECPKERTGPTEGMFDVAGWNAQGWSRISERIFPCINWMRSYKWNEYFKADVVAGLTVGTMLVPQAMSYSKLAGLHPIYGLYSGFLPVFTYVIFGSSRQLGVGPVAMLCLLISNGLLSIIDPDESATEEAREAAQNLYTGLAIQLALLVGAVECLMGLMKLGWLIRFISHAVVSGFTTASAVIIGLSQAKSFLGYEITRSSELTTIVKSIIDGANGFMWQPFVMGSATLALLLVMKHLGKTYKHLRYMRSTGPLTAIIVGTAFVKLFRPVSISVVGTVPRGFPSFSFSFNFAYARQLLPHALLVCGVGILESVGIAKTLAAKNGYEIDSNQELFGLGISNVVGSLFSAMPVAGSFSRSAVMNESGAKTGFSGLVVFFLMGATLLVLTPAFTDVPQCALAAIVVSAVMGLFDYEEAIFLWRVEKRDLLFWAAACLFTLFFGIEIGVLVGVGLSLVFVIYESANPHTAILGRLPGTTVYRNIKQYPDAYTYHGIVIIRLDAPIYFANISFMKDKLRGCENYVGNCAKRRGVPVDQVYYIILEMSPVTYIDSSAVHAIIELYNNYKSRGIQLALCNPNRTVMKTLSRAGVPEQIGREWYFVRVHDAVQMCKSQIQASTGKAEISDQESEKIIEVNASANSSSSQLWEADTLLPLLRGISTESVSKQG